MLNCENCGKSFEEAVDRVVEVTSLRVLCPTCTAARAAAKARKAAAAARPGGDGKPAAAPAASIPAKRVQARTESAPTPAPAAARPKPAPPAPSAAAPASRAGKPAVDGRKPGATPEKKAEKKPKIDLDSLASKNLQKKGSREVWLAFGGVLLVFGVAGVVLWKVMAKKNAEQAEINRAKAEIDDFRTKFRAFDITTEAGAGELIAYGEEHRRLWEESDELGTEVIGRTAKAKDYLQHLEAQTDLIKRLEEIETVMSRAAELPPGELAEQLRRMDELKTKSSIVGPEFDARLDKDRADGERVHMERLIATAEGAAATDPLDRAALTTLATVEDDVHRVFENVYRLWDKNKQEPGLAEKKSDYELKYKHVIELSDASVEHFFTPEVVEAMPWRDLLADPSAWKSSELKGFEHVIDNGQLHLIGPDPTADGQGVMSIGDKEVWRDFVLEMEITLVRGSCELFFRLSPAWQKNVESLELTTDEGGLEAERLYTYRFSIIASQLSEQQLGEDTDPLPPTKVSWTQIRKGAFGISVPKGTEIKITRMRAKVLR